MPFTTATANKIIDKLLKNTDFTPPSSLYVSLHTGNPGDTGANEVVPGSNAYVRKAITFSSASNKATTNTGIIEFANMPSVNVNHVGLWSASTGGVFWWGGALVTSKVVSAGDIFRIAIGDFDITLT